MARQFADVIRDLAGGRTYDELTAALAEVTAAVMETRKVGSITLQIKIKPSGENSVLVTDTIKSVVPEKSRGETVFFTLADGSLRRDDPRQEDLPLREVTEQEQAGELRDVGNE